MALLSQMMILGTERLNEVSGNNSEREALILLGYVMDRQTSLLQYNLDEEISTSKQNLFKYVVDKRCQYQPISQIIGKRYFWNYQFLVTPDVLDPRPDTETLIEQALVMGPFKRILDLGTGSGCILLSLLSEYPLATGLGVDVSEKALNVANENASLLGINDRAQFRIGNWCEGLFEKFDLIISNPPYIAEVDMNNLSKEVLDWEPRIALTPEGDGLSAYKSILTSAGQLMSQDGTMILEIGFDQAVSVTAIAYENNFHTVRIIKDINDKDRALVIT